MLHNQRGENQIRVQPGYVFSKGVARPMSQSSQESSAPQRAIKSTPRRSFATLRAILALMLREMSTTNGRSPGGYIWAILEPVGGIALLTLVFSAAFRAPSIGISFPMFYATGFVPFVMFSNIQNKVSQSLQFSRPLLAYPNVTFLDAVLARFMLNLMTELMVGYIIFIGIIMMFETRVSPNLPVIVEAYALTALLALGVGTLNTFLVTRFPVWQQVWSIVMRPMFIVSCVIFLYDTVPQPYRDWLWWNPLVHLVGTMRHGFYPTYDAVYVSPLYVVGVALTCLAVGLVFLRRYYRDLLER